MSALERPLVYTADSPQLLALCQLCDSSFITCHWITHLRERIAGMPAAAGSRSRFRVAPDTLGGCGKSLLECWNRAQGLKPLSYSQRVTA
jgi:hypothetical protein